MGFKPISAFETKQSYKHCNVTWNYKEVFMAVCDVCSKELMKPEGYLLVTDEVVTVSNYWEYAFNNQWSYMYSMDPKGESLAHLVLQQAGQKSPWIICKNCVSLFDIDNEKAREKCEKWWENQNWAPRNVGPCLENPKVMIAAVTGWKNAFGTNPNFNLVIKVEKKKKKWQFWKK